MNDAIGSAVLTALTALAATTSLIATCLFLARKFWPSHYVVVWRRSMIGSLFTSFVGCIYVLAYERQLRHLAQLRASGDGSVSGLELGLATLFVLPVVVGTAAGIVLGVALAVMLVRPAKIEESPRRRLKYTTIAALASATVIFVSFVFPFFLRT